MRTRISHGLHGLRRSPCNPCEIRVQEVLCDFAHCDNYPPNW